MGCVKISNHLLARGRNTDGAYFVDVQLNNSGTGNARKLRVDLGTAFSKSGGGKTAVLSPAFPMTFGFGNLDVGSSQTIHIVLKLPATVRQFALGEVGHYENVKGSPDLFAGAQNITP